MEKDLFIQALVNNSYDEMLSIPKSDLHSHAGRGGHVSYIEKILNVKITPLSEPLDSLEEMDVWFRSNIKCHFPDKSGYIPRIAAAFAQAKADNIAIMALSYGFDEVGWLGGIEVFMTIMNGLHQHFAPDTQLLPDITITSPINLHELETVLQANWFKGVDMVNYGGQSTMSQMKDMFRVACRYGLTLKAHLGEFAGTEDIWKCAEELELNQIQHGIRAAESPQLLKWLANHKIQLNVCPTSNIMLKNSQSYKTHQIRTLVDYGVPVTINTDDLLIFNATVSQEYLNLYNAGLMTADELNIIRETGLAINI